MKTYHPSEHRQPLRISFFFQTISDVFFSSCNGAFSIRHMQYFCDYYCCFLLVGNFIRNLIEEYPTIISRRNVFFNEHSDYAIRGRNAHRRRKTKVHFINQRTTIASLFVHHRQMEKFMLAGKKIYQLFFKAVNALQKKIPLKKRNELHWKIVCLFYSAYGFKTWYQCETGASDWERMRSTRKYGKTFSSTTCKRISRNICFFFGCLLQFFAFFLCHMA